MTKQAVVSLEFARKADHTKDIQKERVEKCVNFNPTILVAFVYRYKSRQFTL